MYILAVFRSRTHTLEFVSEMRKCGAPAQTVSTPKQARSGCGLSCKFPASFLSQARGLAEKYTSFGGFFKIIPLTMGNDYKRI